MQNIPNICELINNQLLINDISQYEMGEKIGEGTFAKVFLATHKITNEKVAIKILDKCRINRKEDQERINNEIEILKKIKHYNIIKLLSTFENDSKIYIIQEYIEGQELFEYIQNNKKLSEREACLLYQQIISGIEYLHKLGIAHRDLKPENILLSTTNVLKIIDFGLSILYSKNELLKTLCGSPCYAPPEMIGGKKYKGLSSDIWSSGIILFLMLAGHLPFNELTNKKLYNKILSGKYVIPKDISEEGKDLIRRILEVNPKKRIKINEIKEHPWFNMVNRIFNMHDGIDIKKTVIPLDEEIIEKMYKIGFNKMQVRDTILRNLYNNISTTYYLLLGQKIRENQESIADLFSYSYERYMEDKKNNISNYNNDIINVLKEKISSKGKLEELPNFEKKEKNINTKTKKNKENVNSRNKKKINKNHTNECNKFVVKAKDIINENENENENEKKKFEKPLTISERINYFMIQKEDNISSEKCVSPIDNINIIYNLKEEQNCRFNDNNKDNNNDNNNDKIMHPCHSNEILLNIEKNNYIDSEPNNKKPLMLMSMNIKHKKHNKSTMKSMDYERNKFSIINEIIKDYKNKHKSLDNKNKNKENPLNNIKSYKKNIKLKLYTSASGDLFNNRNEIQKKSKKYSCSEISISKNNQHNMSNNEDYKTYIRIRKRTNKQSEIRNDNNYNYQKFYTKGKSNSVRNIKNLKKGFKNNIKISTNNVKKQNPIFSNNKNKSTKNIYKKQFNLNYSIPNSNDNNSKIKEQKDNYIKVGNKKNEKAEVLNKIDEKEEKKLKNNRNKKSQKYIKNVYEEEYNYCEPLDLSMIFFFDKTKVLSLLKNHLYENDIYVKSKKIDGNNKKLICSQDDSILFEIEIENDEKNKNNYIRIRTIRGEKDFYTDLFNSINCLIQKN